MVKKRKTIDSRQGYFDCVVVTGLSGAGKTVALRALEDLGYFCVDNLPLQLLPSLITLYKTWGQKITRVAVGVDVRTSVPEKEFHLSLARLRKQGFRFRVIFLESDHNTLVRRFSETRRRHPLGRDLIGGIRKERRSFRDVKSMADKIIDTSRMTPSEMKEIVVSTLGVMHPHGLAVILRSFGYKYGIPLDSDLVWDVRFLPNPYYLPNLRFLTGKNKKVSNYVLKNDTAKRFLSQIKKILELVVKGFAREGKSYLTIAVGCTGGQHRSVAVAEALSVFMTKKMKLDVRIQHRDVET